MNDSEDECSSAEPRIFAEIITKNQNLDRHAYDAAYAFWQAEWTKAITEQGLVGLSVGVSDKFVGADEVLVFRAGASIAALALINHIDLGLAAYADIGYLKALPADGKALIRKLQPRRVMASGYNIVARRYRRTKIGRTPISVVLPGVVVALFERRAEFDLCMGMPLTACGNHRTLERLGMKDMHEGTITLHNVGAKFMYVERGSVDLGPYGDDIRSVLEQPPPASSRSRVPVQLYDRVAT